MNIKYIPIYRKYFPLINRMTNEEKGDFLTKEMDFLKDGTEPRFLNPLAEALHAVLWADLVEISDAKEKKKQYDAERYKNKKKNETMNG